MSNQVAAGKLSGATGPLALLSAYSWLFRSYLAEAMALFPLLLMVRLLYGNSYLCPYLSATCAGFFGVWQHGRKGCARASNALLEQISYLHAARPCSVEWPHAHGCLGTHPLSV